MLVLLLLCVERLRRVNHSIEHYLTEMKERLTDLACVKWNENC